MIRYADATPGRLEREVDALVPRWRASASARTISITAAGAYSEGQPSWSDVKLVYMRLQHFKCVFCERPLAREVAGKIEQDVEHFRPKNAVKPWPPRPKGAKAASYPFSTGGRGSGYHWLAYALDNYAAACKPCNSTRKSNYFPIAAAARGASAANVRALNSSEKPFLIYPLGKMDADPETLIEFEGIVARPKATKGHARKRAIVTIDFLGLNAREELWADRFRTITSIWLAVKLLHVSTDPREQEAARETVLNAVADDAPQAACARSFLQLFDADPEKAWRIYEDARAYLKGAVP